MPIMAQSLFIYLFEMHFSSPIMGMSIVPRGLQVDLVMALDLYIHIYIYINILSFKSELHRLLSLIF